MPHPAMIPQMAPVAVARFHHLWTYGAITAVLSGVIGAFIPKPEAHLVELTHEPALVDAAFTPAVEVL